jgi:hypothetical protein
LICFERRWFWLAREENGGRLIFSFLGAEMSALNRLNFNLLFDLFEVKVEDDGKATQPSLFSTACGKILHM